MVETITLMKILLFSFQKSLFYPLRGRFFSVNATPLKYVRCLFFQDNILEFGSYIKKCCIFTCCFIHLLFKLFYCSFVTTRKLICTVFCTDSGSWGNTDEAPITIQAHDGPISCLALNLQGSLLATASHKVGKLTSFHPTFHHIIKGSDYWSLPQ